MVGFAIALAVTSHLRSTFYTHSVLRSPNPLDCPTACACGVYVSVRVCVRACVGAWVRACVRALILIVGSGSLCGLAGTHQSCICCVE